MKTKSILIKKERQPFGDNAFVEVIIWEVPTPVPSSQHGYKYRLVYVIDDVCVLRYDNEAGKGDHKHIGDVEVAFTFTTKEALLADFWADVDKLES